MTKSIYIAFLAIGLAGPAWAQNHALSATDEAYLTKEASGAAYELETAKVAASKAVRPDIKSYAAKLVTDHETYNAALSQFGKDQGIILSNELDAADKGRLQALQQASGAAFDALYLQEALRVNKQDKGQGDAEKAATKNDAVKAFIGKFDAMDEEHERLAKQLEKNKV